MYGWGSSILKITYVGVFVFQEVGFDQKWHSNVLASTGLLCQKCQLYPLSVKLHIWEFWSIRKWVLTIKIVRTDHSGLTRRFGHQCKFWHLSLNFCNWGFSCIRNSVVTIKILYKVSFKIEGLHVECINFILWSRDCMFWCLLLLATRKSVRKPVRIDHLIKIDKDLFEFWSKIRKLSS